MPNMYGDYQEEVSNDNSRKSTSELLDEKAKKELRAYVRRTGQVPDDETLENILGRGALNSEQKKLEVHNFVQSEFGDELKTDTMSQYYQDPRRIYDAMRGRESVQGTSENALYQIALEQRSSQLQAQDQELGLAERDMQVQLSENRQQLMNDIRNRRRSLLKSGLSSAQVANEEVQSLLQRQQEASQIAQNYYGQRQQAQTQMRTAPQDSAMRAYEMAQGLSQTGAQYAAAGASDPDELARRYAKQTGSSYTQGLENMTLKNR